MRSTDAKKQPKARISRPSLGMLIALSVWGSFTCPTSSAQPVLNFPGSEPGGSYPNDLYYVALEIYRDGDLEIAIDRFDNALSRSRKDVNGRWIDSIPVHAMLAECYWHAGNLPACQANLDQVFQLAIRHRGWLGRIDWNGTLQANVVRSQTRGLWPGAAAVRVLPTSRRASFLSGQQVTEQSLAQGGTFENLNIKSIDAIEIMRGVALASYRRRVIMGTLAKQDPLATELLEATKYPAQLNSAFGKSLIGAMRGAERFGVVDDARVTTEAAKYATYQNGVHPLSPALLLCRTSVAAGAEQWMATPQIAETVANAAAALEQPELVGEAMQLAAGCATPATARTVANLGRTAATGLSRRSRLASLHCLIAAADASVTAGDATGAAELIRQAQTLSARRDVVQPRLDAYGGYVAARLAALNGGSFGMATASDVDQSIASVSRFAFERTFRGRPVPSMPRVYQLQSVTRMAGASGGGESVIAEYCRQIPADVWRRDPVDGIAASLVDKSAPLTTWLGMALGDSDGGAFLQRLDVVLADRFLRRLALGGRLAQVRTLACAPETALQGLAQDFLKKAPPSLVKLRAAVTQPVPADRNAAIAQSDAQESLATQLALERIDLPRVTPKPLDPNPAADPKPFADRLPRQVALLTFTMIGNRLVGTFTADGQTDLWTVGGAGRLTAEIGNLLKGIGVGKNRGNRLPEDDSWKEWSAKVGTRLFPESVQSKLGEFEKLVIVPDGLLWYLPFELLPAGEGDDTTLGGIVEVRYAATPGSAFNALMPPSTGPTVALVGGSFFVPQDSEANEGVVVSILDRLDGPRRLGVIDKVPSSLIGDGVGVLAVGSARGVDPAEPLAFSVGSYDAGSPMGSLKAWMRLPAATPRSVVLSGFRTPVEAGQMGNGTEIFLTLNGLQAAGVRDVLLSRWPVGGQSTATMLRELLPEIPFAGMSAAWHRSRGVLKETELDPAGEPLIPKSQHDREGVTGGMPLFWAGYLVASPIQWDDLTGDAAVDP